MASYGCGRTAPRPSGVTDSFVERFGLFTIIVLGEVVIEGIGEAEELTVRTVATGVIALTIGFGIWWNYFNSLGRRIPDENTGKLASWFIVHFPLTMGIAAGGAAMVSLVEHAADPQTPAATAWLLTGSVTVVLASIGIAAQALPDERIPQGWLRQLIPNVRSVPRTGWCSGRRATRRPTTERRPWMRSYASKRPAVDRSARPGHRWSTGT